VTRYIYVGPYQVLTITDNGTEKTVGIGEEVDLSDTELVDDQIRRGFHMFEVVGDSPATTAPEPEPEPPAVVVEEATQEAV